MGLLVVIILLFFLLIRWSVFGGIIYAVLFLLGITVPFGACIIVACGLDVLTEMLQGGSDA